MLRSECRKKGSGNGADSERDIGINSIHSAKIGETTHQNRKMWREKGEAITGQRNKNYRMTMCVFNLEPFIIYYSSYCKLQEIISKSNAV